MTIQELYNKVKNSGLPLLWVQDPIQKLPSVSLTLLIVSFFYVQTAILSNWLVFLKGINSDVAVNLFLATAGLYFGRRLSAGKNTGGVEKE